MNKILFLISFATSLIVYAQQKHLIINNYTAYDFWGNVEARGINGPSPCYPVLSPVTSSAGGAFWITVPAAPLTSPYFTTLDVGLYSSGPVIPYFSVFTSPSSTGIPARPFGHISLIPTGTISTNSDWDESKFHMTYPGTTNYIPNGGVNLSRGISPCSPAYPSNFNMSFSPTYPIAADWFTIGTYTYIEVYPSP